MSAQKTRRVFHYAEVLEGETHEPNGAGYTLSIQPTTGIIFTGYIKTPIEGDWVPVYRLPETTEPVPPASTKIPFPENGMPPRTERIRIVFEDETRSTQAFPDANGKNWYLKTDGTIVFVEECDEIPWNSIPLQRAETRTPAPAPRTRTRIVFTPVDVPEADAKGNYWSIDEQGRTNVLPHPNCPAHSKPVRKTVETITVEPERWAVTTDVCTLGGGSFYAQIRVIQPDTLFDGATMPTREQAEADLPLLKRLAEQCAAAHGAVVVWEGVK